MVNSTNCVLLIIHTCQLESRRKCGSILGMRHQVLWFLSRLEEGAVCVFPLAVCLEVLLQ